MAKRLHLTVDKSGIRLDLYVSQQVAELSRSYAQKLINNGHIRVNDRAAKASQKLTSGDRITITIPPPPSLPPEDIPVKIVYEDSDLLVINKPAGLSVHPGPGHSTHTLVNAILAHYPDLAAINDTIRPGIVHRLDKDTSGLMMIAKNKMAQLRLSQQIKARTVVKGYLTLVVGHLFPERGAIEAPIGRHPRNRKRMTVVPGGKEARTQYQVARYIGNYTLVEVTLETGRTHQIRVHFSALGHPVFGDAVYGKPSPLLRRQFLHAHHLGFRLPSSGDWVEFSSELPQELKDALESISNVLESH